MPALGDHPAPSQATADDRLTLLVETIEALSEARSVEDVAAVIRGSARRISGADGVTFVLRDGAHCHYLDEDAIGPLWKGHRFPMDSCISGWAMMNKETVVIPEVRDDPRIPQDAYRPTFVRSLVMTPVRASDPLAAIGAYWDHVRQPTPDEVASLSAIARATATALENVSLLGSLEGALKKREALILELDHRVKNTLASTLAMAKQTLRSTADPAAFNEAFTGRLMALSRAHELLARCDWAAAGLRESVEQGLAEAEGDSRISMAGPPATLPTETAVSLVLAVRELLDNARRHGALTRQGGRVEVGWGFDGTGEDAGFNLVWRESGGPSAEQPGPKGLGLRLIEQGLGRAFGGKTECEFSPAGFTFRLRAPVSTRVQPA